MTQTGLLPTKQDKRNCTRELNLAMTKLQGIAARNATQFSGVVVMLTGIFGMLERLERYRFMNTENVRSALRIAAEMLTASIRGKKSAADADRLYDTVLSATYAMADETPFVGQFEDHLVLATIGRRRAGMHWGIVRLVLDERFVLDADEGGFAFGTLVDPSSLGEAETAFMHLGDINARPPESMADAVHLGRRFMEDILDKGL